VRPNWSSLRPNLISLRVLSRAHGTVDLGCILTNDLGRISWAVLKNAPYREEVVGRSVRM
jgi:hypothetical protein